jgi:hypothetical protein
LLIGAVFAMQVAFHCKEKPDWQLKHVVRAPVTQVAQFVPHVVVLVVTGLTHAVVPVYGAVQAEQTIALDAMVQVEQPVTPPVTVVVAGLEIPVWQLTQAPELITYPALQAVQVPTAEHVTQLVSVHAAAQAPLARKYPAEHWVHVAPAAVPPLVKQLVKAGLAVLAKQFEVAET